MISRALSEEADVEVQLLPNGNLAEVVEETSDKLEDVPVIEVGDGVDDTVEQVTQ